MDAQFVCYTILGVNLNYKIDDLDSNSFRTTGKFIFGRIEPETLHKPSSFGSSWGWGICISRAKNQDNLQIIVPFMPEGATSGSILCRTLDASETTISSSRTWLKINLTS